ncbi:MAG TPA: KTSC domain-containing protein [Thermoanaerobaculia bacterium]|nr:KTSC domain-containing protein [Thermoanaerobaculia bacterium]
MRRNPVESSAISSVGYDPRRETLEVEFRSGTIYRFFAVPAEIYKDFLRSSSKGRFFGQRIRGRFDSTRDQ